MDASQVLRDEAETLVLRADNRALYLKAQLEQMQAQRDAIESERREINHAPKRLLSYQPRIGAEYQCPGCWIDRGEQGGLPTCPEPPSTTSCVAMPAAKTGAFPSDR
jgi:hypothetical protein